MPRLAVGKHLPVRLKSLHIQIIEPVMRQDFVVAAILHLLSQHPLDILFGHRPIALIQAAIGMAKRIGGEIHRAQLARRTRHVNQQQRATIQAALAHMRITQQIGADLLAVVQIVEQLRAHLGHILDTNRLELPFALAHTQNNQPAVGIGHGAVTGPKILRQRAFAIPSQRQLVFQRHALAQQR